jgi:hypothetical protein
VVGLTGRLGVWVWVRLTIPPGAAAGGVHKFDLFLIQACQGSQVLVFAILREGVDALVAVVEVR